jgi:hypothetical protein
MEGWSAPLHKRNKLIFSMERPNNGRRIGFAANVWTQFELAAKQSIRSPERPVLFSNTTRLELRFLGKTTPPGTAKHQVKSQIMLLNS